MLKNNFLVGFILVFNALAISYTFADQQCAMDMSEMDNQISQYGSVSAIPGVNLTSVSNPQPGSNQVCFGNGQLTNGDNYSIMWGAGNWGNTLCALNVPWSYGYLCTAH